MRGWYLAVVAGDMDDFWVFGYGSLMWNPGFEYAESQTARAFGFRRSLCVWSHVYRGTPQSPGLVLGLDRGGSCCGMAFRVRAAAREPVLDYLRRRELVTNVYHERMLPLALADGRQVRAVGYVVDRDHDQYAGGLDIAAAAGIVARSSGDAGPNSAYVFNTLTLLRQMGIRDLWLEGVASSIAARNAVQDDAVPEAV